MCKVDVGKLGVPIIVFFYVMSRMFDLSYFTSMSNNLIIFCALLKSFFFYFFTWLIKKKLFKIEYHFSKLKLFSGFLCPVK